MKRIICLLLALVLLIGMLPVNAQAATLDNGLEYKVYADHVEITGYTGKAPKLVIPAEIEGKPVTAIGYSAFNRASRLTSIVIPDSVTSIDVSAFSGCSSLTDIDLPDSVTYIGEDAFQNCTSLTRIDIPENVASIGEDAFYKCAGLTGIYVDENNQHFSSDERGVLFNYDKTCLIQAPGALAGAYTIPESVTTITDRSFYQCGSLTDIVIPEGVTAIPTSAFEGCTSLTNADIPDSITSIGNFAFYRCERLTSINIPEYVNSIGVQVFCECDALTGIYVDESNRHFSSDEWGVLFDYDKTCLIRAPGAITGSYTVPEGVSSIGDQAFYYCDDLTSIDFPASVTSIGDHAVYNCFGLTSVRFHGDAPELTLYSFGNNEFTAYYPACHDTWTDDVRHNYASGHIDWVVYQLASPHEYTSVVTEPTCTELGFTTYTCACGSSYVFDYVPALGHDYKDNTCTRCKSSDALQYSVQEDYVEIFGYSGGPGSVSIPAEIEGKPVTRILSQAFLACEDLISVDIPDSVTYIGSRAFGSCTSLTGIHVDENNQYYSSDERGVLFDRDKTRLIQAPGALAGAYKMPESVTAISSYAFRSCHDLTNVEIPQGVTSIGSYAFNFCTSLTSIDIPVGVTRINEETFGSCSSLTSANIGQGVTYIGNEAFAHCTSLTDIHIPESVIEIGDVAFSQCRSLTDIDLPDSLVSIGTDVFAYCRSLTRVDIPASVTYIGEHPFCECENLTGIYVDENNRHYSSDDRGILFDRNKTYLIQAPAKIAGSYTVPDGVTSIGVAAFYQCLDLTSVDIPESVTFIGRWSFRAGRVLRSIRFHGDAPEIENNAFASPTIYYPAGNPTWIGIQEQIDIYDDLYWVPYDASHIYEYIITIIEPTCTEQGFTTYACECGVSYVSYADALGHNYSFGTCTRCGEIDPNHQEIPSPADPGNGMFAPDDVLTRGMFFYALWNYCGSPEPASTENPFTDVSESDYYCDAILWAVENGFSLGTSATWFGADDDVYRAQAVTWLWRSAGSPEPPEENPYTDVRDGDYYSKAALWAAANGYMHWCTHDNDDYGYMDPTHFGPNIQCLYRDISWIPSPHPHKYTATVTAPTCTAQGFTIYSCTFCEHSYPATYVDPLGHDYVDGVCTRCESAPDDGAPEVPSFADVSEGEWFYDSVSWAVENGITNGTSEDSFSPNDQCLRAHVVTFLWRANGCPEPTTTDNSFTDVKESDFFYKAVLWAVEKGITNGTSDTTFGSYDICNRAQVVTFLHRAMGSPAPADAEIAFTDVPAGAWYTAPVAWAVENGITNGLTATEFGPDASCNRAQVVTFLYRAYS